MSSSALKLYFSNQETKIGKRKKTEKLFFLLSFAAVLWNNNFIYFFLFNISSAQRAHNRSQPDIMLTSPSDNRAQARLEKLTQEMVANVWKCKQPELLCTRHIVRAIEMDVEKAMQRKKHAFLHIIWYSWDSIFHFKCDTGNFHA
jgi:CDP-glycerol glycerophosphotransferase (TagB/SpsB family)